MKTLKELMYDKEPGSMEFEAPNGTTFVPWFKVSGYWHGVSLKDGLQVSACYSENNRIWGVFIPPPLKVKLYQYAYRMGLKVASTYYYYATTEEAEADSGYVVLQRLDNTMIEVTK